MYQQHQAKELSLPPLLKKCLDLYYHMSAGILTSDVRVTREVLQVFGTKAWFKLYCENAMHKHPPLEYDEDVLNEYSSLFEEYVLWLSERLAAKNNTVALAFLSDDGPDIVLSDMKCYGDALVQWATKNKIGCSEHYVWPHNFETSLQIEM